MECKDLKFGSCLYLDFLLLTQPSTSIQPNPTYSASPSLPHLPNPRNNPRSPVSIFNTKFKNLTINVREASINAIIHKQ